MSPTALRALATRRLPRALVALGSGALFATTAPPTDFHAGILLGLVGFALALEPGPAEGAADDASPTQPARAPVLLGWCFGVGANLVALRFVPEVILRFTPLPAVAAWLALFLLAAAQALIWAAGAALALALTRRAKTPSWLAFGTGIYVATFLPAVFPWTPAGGLTPWPALVQTAEVVGERGTSFLFALAAGLAAHGIARAAIARNPRAGAAPVALALALVLALIAFGVLRMGSIEARRAGAPHARVTLVQPGFDASERWDASRAAHMIDRLTTLTQVAEQRGTDLTVWPESAFPYTLPHSARSSPLGPRAVLQPGVHGPVLTGAYMLGAPGVGYNAAILATSDGALSEPYDKRHLLVFGEAVPFADWFPWLKKVFIKGTGLAPGTESVVFTIGPIRAAVLNCFEDTLPEAGREAMERAPNLLVNITNDAWFVGSAESELHLRLAVLRAVESRRDLVRAVNEGPTSFVEATGRVHARYDLPMPGTLPTAPALLEDPPTFYARFGDGPLVVLAGLAALAPLLLAIRATKRRERRSA